MSLYMNAPDGYTCRDRLILITFFYVKKFTISVRSRMVCFHAGAI